MAHERSVALPFSGGTVLSAPGGAMPKRRDARVEVEGEWEWPEPAQALRQLENAVRCPLSGKLLVDGTQLPCGHVFDNLSLRDFNASKQRSQCPQCQG